MVKYEYLVIPSDQAEATQHVQTTFSQYGEDGWDLRCMTAKFFVFSRPLVEPEVWADMPPKVVVVPQND